jgi:hypothetical protein
MPNNSESIVPAAWEAISPYHPLSTETQGILLAYFKRVELHGENTVHMIASDQEQRPDEFSSPPTRFIRQPRKKPPQGPTGVLEVTSCSCCEDKWPGAPQNAQPTAVNWNSTAVHDICIENVANGPLDEVH